jgi:hypothetical protein
MIRKLIGRSLAWLANCFQPGYYNLKDQISVMRTGKKPVASFSDIPAEIEPHYRSWQLRSYIPDGYHVRYTKEASKHHEGGPPRHQGAICGTCQRPLLLFWTLDCSEIKHTTQHRLFEQLKYFCIYYCPHHLQATNYRLIDDATMEVFHVENGDLDPGPVDELLDQIPESSLELLPLPHEIAKDLLVADFVSPEYLNEAEKSRLHTFFKMREDRGIESELHSLNLVGLRLPLTQGPEEHYCPNPKCPLSNKDLSLAYSIIQNAYRMKELAVISLNRNPNFPQSYCQITVHVCWHCLALHVDYACS